MKTPFLYLDFIDAQRAYIKNELSDNVVSALLLKIGKEIDRCRVYNEPSAELEKLYDNALWLKCETIK